MMTNTTRAIDDAHESLVLDKRLHVFKGVVRMPGWTIASRWLEVRPAPPWATRYRLDVYESTVTQFLFIRFIAGDYCKAAVDHIAPAAIASIAPDWILDGKLPENGDGQS